ncbi:MAG: hypothetical protein J1F32_07120 [Erysipelotrichales bacterium]|nr:hypothetical protein [Erysipelotrichales bacterium]
MSLDAKKIIRQNKNIIKVDETIVSKDLVELKPALTDFVDTIEDGTIFKSARNTFTDKTGTIKPILTRLLKKEDAFYNEDNLFGITIDETSGVTKGILLDDGVHTIKLIPNGKSGLIGKVSSDDDSKVIFEKFNGSDNLELIVKNNGLQMNIVVSEIKEEQYSYNFKILTTNLYASYCNDMKAIVFVDQNTKDKVFIIANPFMMDKKDAVSSAIESNYYNITENEHEWELKLSKDWLEDTFRQLPIIVSPRIEIIDQPVVTLTNYIDSKKFVNISDELILGVKNYKSYSIRATIITQQIISELVRTGMKKYNVSLELHYEEDEDSRRDDSKGILIFYGSELLSENLLKSTEKNILIDITEIIKKEIQKYKSGMKISNLTIDLIYGDKNSIIGSTMSTGAVNSRNIKDDYVIVKDRLFKEEIFRPEIHLNGVRDGEVVAGTPFLEYETGRAGKTRINLFNNEISHCFELGSVSAKALNIGIKLFYDTRFLKEQIKKGLSNFFGKGWLLNVSQRLVKNDNYSKLLGCKDIIYYDGENNPHTLSEKWYYEKDGARHYIQKDLVYIGNDQKLKYRNPEGDVFEVEYEASNEDGLTLISTNSKLNYIKKSDLKVHKHFFIKLFDNKYEVFVDDGGMISIPHVYFTDISRYYENKLPEWLSSKDTLSRLFNRREYEKYSRVKFKDNCFYDLDDNSLQVEEIKRPLVFKNNKYYVRCLSNKYLQVTSSKELIQEFVNYENEGIDVELEVTNEYYVNRNVPIADYYENEDITNVNSQILQHEEQIKSLKQQIESASNGIIRLENELDQQRLNQQFTIEVNSIRDDATKAYNNAYDTTIYKAGSATEVDETKTYYNECYRNASQDQTILSDECQTKNYKHQISSFESQLLEQQRSLQILLENLSKFESQLLHLNERKEVLVKSQKEGIQDYIMDTSGSILGFDYFGKLVYISDQNENEIIITYDDNKIMEVASKEQKMVFHYGDNNMLDYIIDTQGRRKIFEMVEENLYKVSFLAEFNEKQSIIFKFDGDRIGTIDDLNIICTDFIWENNCLTRVIQSVTNSQFSDNVIYKIPSRKTTKDNKILEIEGGVKVTNLISEDVTYYHFDHLGRLVFSTNVDKTDRDETRQFFHFDERKMLYNVSLTTKDKIHSFNMGIGMTTKQGVELNVAKDIVSTNLPSNGFIFAQITLHKDMLEMNEFTLYANVKDKNGKIRNYSQKFNDLTCNIIGLPIILGENDETLEFIISTTKEINLSNMDNVTIYGAEGSICEYDEKEHLIREIIGFEEINYDDFVDDKPTIITRVDKFGIKRISHQLFDSFGRIVFFEDHLHNCKETFYDEKGNVIEERQYNKEAPTLARIIKYSFDEFGNVSKIDGVMRDENGEFPQESCTYLPNTSKLSSIKYPGGQVTCYGYDFNTDDLLEISSDSMGQGNSTRMVYRFGLLTSLAHHGFRIHYVLDSQGRKIAVFVQGQKLISYEYDDDYSFEDKNHCSIVTKKTIDGYEISTIKDKKGKLLMMLDSEDKIRYYYDEDDNLVYIDTLTGEVVETHYLKNKKVEHNAHKYDGLYVAEDYTYNSLELLNMTRYSDSDNLEFQTYFNYDNAHDNRIIGVDISSGTQLKVDYDALGRVVSKKVLNDNHIILEDEFDFLQYGENTIDLINEHIIKVNGEVLDIVSYKYDVAGNIISEERDEFKTRYGYDKLNRLVREDNPRLNKTNVYKYDNGGNILLKKEYPYTLDEQLIGGVVTNYTYRSDGWRDQLVKFDGKEIKYDEMGRPVQIGSDYIYWNTKGRMTSFGDSSYKYDLNGIRKNKNDIQYFHLGNKIIKEKSYERNHEIVFEYAMDKLVGFIYNGTKYFYERNIQGDILRIFDAKDVSLVAEYIYDAWGNHKVLDANGNEDLNPQSIGNVNPFRYRGYYYDAETNLYYLNSRYYSPKMGRFISPDEFSILDKTMVQVNGVNLYMYCKDNPVMNTDPSGYLVVSLLVGLVAGMIIGTAYGAVTAAANGQNILAGAIIGGVAGGLLGVLSAFGAICMAPLLLGTPAVFGLGATASFALGLSVTMVGSFIVATGSDVTLQLANNDWDFSKVNFESACISGAQWTVLNTFNALTCGLAPGLSGGVEFLLDTMTNLLYGGIGLIIDAIRGKATENNNSAKKQYLLLSN